MDFAEMNARAAVAAEAAEKLLTHRNSGDPEYDLEWCFRYLMNFADEKQLENPHDVSVSRIMMRVLLERHEAEVIRQMIHEVEEMETTEWYGRPASGRLKLNGRVSLRRKCRGAIQQPHK